jgi:hypothetical protein
MQGHRQQGQLVATIKSYMPGEKVELLVSAAARS